jgi:hypothetical protein
MMDQLDPDGIDLCLFNDMAVWHRNVHKDAVQELFNKSFQRGGTILAPVLQATFDEYFRTRKRPVTIVVVTDGQPQDKPAVIQTIVSASKQLAKIGGRDEDIGISFIQIGYDREATRFLKELDDNLQDEYGAPFDLVDTGKSSSLVCLLLKCFMLTLMYVLWLQCPLIKSLDEVVSSKYSLTLSTINLPFICFSFFSLFWKNSSLYSTILLANLKYIRMT